jgi:hypothetical protein
LHIASFIKKALKGGFVWNHGQSWWFFFRISECELDLRASVNYNSTRGLSPKICINWSIGHYHHRDLRRDKKSLC